MKELRVPLLILVCMVLIGAGMYYFSTLQPPPGEYDTINITKTADSITKKVKIFVADNPIEIYHLDSIWLKSDSTPLKKVLDGSKLNFMNKKYSTVTLMVTYNDRLFYDLAIDKSDPRQSFEFSFQIKKERDTFFIDGTVDRNEGELVSFRAPMMPLYKQFVLTYNDRLPPPPPDSTATDDSSIVDSIPVERGPQPGKTITVLQN